MKATVRCQFADSVPTPCGYKINEAGKDWLAIMASATLDTSRPEIANSFVIGGSSTNYHDVGEGDPVLLVHGSGPGVTAWANWRLNIPVLAQDFRVIAPDMFGFGYSDSKGRIEDKQVWVDQLASFLDGLGIDKISMVGNSFGAGI